MMKKGMVQMEVKEALLKRRSIRKFTQEAVSAENVDELLHAAMSAPSACNKKPWQFYVVTNPDKLTALRSSSHFTKITAPLAIIVCGDLKHALPFQMADYWVQDCSAATQCILLRATDLGLGAVWCGIYPQKQPQERVRLLLGLDDKQIPLNIIFIGHPDEEHRPRDQYDADRVHLVD